MHSKISLTICASAILFFTTQTSALGNPQPQQMTRAQAYFSEIVGATEPYRLAVTDCYLTTGSLSKCNAGSNKVPPGITMPIGHVYSLSVIEGVITVIPVAESGILTTDTFTLTPKLTKSNTIMWEASGDSIAKGYVK